MSGNSYGQLFKVSTYGESHGEAIGCMIDGCPPNLKIDLEGIQKDLDRRKPGKTRHTSQRRESDTVKILSGVFDGKTTVPYKENSSTNPLSVYGLTKLKGEESLLRIK